MGANGSSEIVIPDTCVDIIYRIDDMGNVLTSEFIGINDRSFLPGAIKKPDKRFRCLLFVFYAWSANAFSEDSFIGTVNGRYDVRERYNWLDRELRRRLSESGNVP